MTEHDHTEAGASPLKGNTGEMRAQLTDLIERAAAKDAIKDFNTAAELYSEATELQAKLNGELSLDNADLLYAYGKALYNVAVSKSDVLGTKVAGDAPSENASSSMPASVGDGLVQNAIASGMAQKEMPGEKNQFPKVENKPYFQFTGDENFDDSNSDEEDEGEERGGAEEDEDDFANAFEVLDLARILYLKKLDAAEEYGKGKAADLPSQVKHVKERLADTYDLQAEISLEAERFADAVADLRTALDLRQSLFPREDPSIAECHYKLSLALEFASVNKADDKSDGDSNVSINEGMRKEAVTQMEKAIESCQVRMAQEQGILDTDGTLDEDRATAMKRKIANVKEIISDMEQRLVDLKRPPALLEDRDESSEAMLKGIMGQMMGQSPAEQRAQLAKVTKDANDLSAFVKRKSGGNQPAPRVESTQKRLAQEGNQEGIAKRARFDSTGGPTL
ncbi:hypothetical protein BBP40_009040 [Aspergillus hancockii]|nr:hypothetical protein BBP40_009040 [Aspergillus hancockii]